jgi:putative transposase
MERHRKKCERIETPRHAHALTFSCYHRQAFLSRDRTRQWFADAIEESREKHPFDLWAYVIMPEHVHLLIRPREEVYSISRMLTSLKLPVTKKAISFLKETSPESLQAMRDAQPNGEVAYRFWQRGGGYDQNIFEPRTAYAVIDYIHANPVRRGLCERPVDWMWSSAREYEFPGEGLLRVDKNSLPQTDLS